MEDEAATIEEKLRELQLEEDATAFIDLLNRLGWDIRVGEDWGRVLELARDAGQLARSRGYQCGVAGSLRNAAFAHYMLSDLETAFSEAYEALRLYQEASDTQGEAQSRAVVAFVHWTLGNFEVALRESVQALEMAEGRDQWSVGACCLLIGGIHQSLRDHDQAARYHKRSLEVFSQLDDPLLRARSLIGVAATLQAKGETEEALNYLHQGLEIFQRIGSRSGESRVLSDLGTIFEQQGRDAEALELHLRSLQIREHDNSRSAAITSLLNLGRLYLKLGQRQEAFDSARKALGIADEIGAKPKAFPAHQLLSQLYEHEGDLARALFHERAFQRIREEVFNEEASAKLRNFQISVETERSQKEAEIHRLRSAELKAKNEELARLIEELRATQAQLVQTEKIAALGSLVAAIVHEINSPLGAIRSTSDVSELCTARIRQAIQTASSLDELKASRSFATALETLGENQQVSAAGVQRIGNILQSLKSFAQLDRAEYHEIDVNRALEDILVLARPQLRQDVRIAKDFGPVPTLFGYVAELNQVFMNLLQNAAQAIDGTGTITISTFADEISVRIRFDDTGHGISPERLPRLFDPGISTKDTRAKAAMSLFTCFNIVQKHGGMIHVESVLGEGASFTVELPRTLERPAPVA